MRKTVIVELNDDLLSFVHQQDGTSDPSAFINRLFREEMKRNRYSSDDTQPVSSDVRETAQEAENLIDETIPAAG